MSKSDRQKIAELFQFVGKVLAETGRFDGDTIEIAEGITRYSWQKDCGMLGIKKYGAVTISDDHIEVLVYDENFASFDLDKFCSIYKAKLKKLNF